MKTVGWNDYIKDYQSFLYVFKLPVTNADFKEKILEFDLAFLSSDDKMGLFSYADSVSVDQYIQYRKASFANMRSISLLDLEQFEHLESKNMCILWPDNIAPVSYKGANASDGHLKLEQSGFLRLERLQQNQSWSKVVSLAVYSESSIWWEELDFQYDENGEYIVFNPPINNRFFAYRIVPRFNSFVRDVTAKTLELGGSVFLEEERNEKYVTEKGILLDGKIIYQEDIDEGRVKLPEF